MSTLDRVLKVAERVLVGAREFADLHRGVPLAEEVAAETLNGFMHQAWTHKFETIFQSLLASAIRPSPPGVIETRRAATVLATCEAAGLSDDVFDALRFSIVESNGCVSILESGRLLCSLPTEVWKQRLSAALKEKAP